MNLKTHDRNLGGRSLSGTLPSSICNLVTLTQLVLTGNAIQGGIPPCIGDLRNLTNL